MKLYRMNRTLFRSVLACSVAACTLASIGCSGPSEPTSVANGTTASTTQSSSNDKDVNVVQGANTEAGQVVAIFLDSLRRGDDKAANSVLTTKARNELAKTSYAIQPLGTPEGQYSIGRVGFPYPEKNVALVECVWSEPATVDTPAATMDIVCEVHLEQEGWRISGLGVALSGTDEALVLDFEDASSLQQTIDSATGNQGQTQGAIAGANQPATTPTTTTPTSTGLPAYPGTESTNNATQVAQPFSTTTPYQR